MKTITRAIALSGNPILRPLQTGRNFWTPDGVLWDCGGRIFALSSVHASSVRGIRIDNCRRRGRRVSCSRDGWSGASPRSGVHATQPRLSRRWHYWPHHDGYLRLCRDDVLSEPCPYMASSFGCSPDAVVSALRIIGDFTHYGRRLARGLRSDDDARGRVGDLRNALTRARDHEAPSQSPGP